MNTLPASNRTSSPTPRAGCPVGAPEAGGVVSRRNRSAARQEQRQRFLADNFFRNIRRAKLTETQAALANLICDDSLGLGLRAAVYDSLEDFVQESVVLPPVLNIGKADIHRAIMGSAGDEPQARHERGLSQMGIVRVERLVLDGRMRWLVTPLLDARQWSCGWRVSIERRQTRDAALLAAWGAAEAFLPPLAPEPDLTDALDEVVAESVALPPVGHTVRDALESCVGRSAPVPDGARWESSNAETPAKAGFVGKVPTPLSLKKDLSIRLKSNLKPCQGGEMKEALAKLEFTSSDDEVRASLEVILGQAVADNDAGKWINRRRLNRAKVFTIMAAVVERLLQSNLPGVARVGGLAETYWQKSKESL